MELRQMRYFKAIVEEGTISKAAARLRMAQPPLSIQLKSLEKEIGQPLVIRGHKRVKLTPAGCLFYKRCLQMLSLCELMTNELADLSTQTLRIGITSSNSTPQQQNKIVEFIRDHPKLNVSIKEGTSVEMIDALHSHDIDIGILRTPFTTNDLDTIIMTKEPMVAVGDHELVNVSHDHLSDYRDVPLIVHRRYHTLIVDYCINTLQFNPNIHILSDDCRTAVTWASLLDSVAILPKAMAPLSMPNLSCVDLKDTDLYTNVVVATRKQEPLSPIVKELVEKLRKQAELPEA